jgi:hypothetical protein
MGHIKQFPKLLCSRRGLNSKHSIHGLSGSHVMTTGTNAADLGHDGRKFLHGPSFTELFKTPQFRYLEVNIINLSFISKKDFNFSMAFQAGDRVDGNGFHLFRFFLDNFSSED